jgi:hypothetical protein
MNTREFYTEWSAEDNEYVGRCRQYPSLSWLDADELEAIIGIMKLVAETDGTD